MVCIGFLFINLISGLFWMKITAFWLFFFLSSTVFGLGLRVQVISYLYFLVTLFILKKSSHSQKYLFILPLLMFFWTNTHLGFFTGLILISFYFIENLKSKLPLKIIILIFCVLATFINPFGVSVYKEIFNHFLSPLNKMIAEWAAPVIWQKILIVMLTLIVFVKNIKTKNLSFSQLLLLTFFLYLGLSARRNLPFFYTIFFYLFLNQAKIEVFENLNQIVFPVLFCGIILASIIIIPETIKFNRSWEAYCNGGLVSYPCRAIREFSKLSGNVYAVKVGYIGNSFFC